MCVYICILWITTKCVSSKCGFRQLNTHIYKYRHKRIHVYRFKRVYLYIYIYLYLNYMDKDRV